MRKSETVNTESAVTCPHVTVLFLLIFVSPRDSVILAYIRVPT